MAKLVFIESPYANKESKKESGFIEEYFAGSNERNIRYACDCMRDSFNRGEFPFASHLLYTQRGILNDTIPEERKKGIEAGLVWGKNAELTAVYINLGISNQMKKGIERAIKEGRKVEKRRLSGK